MQVNIKEEDLKDKKEEIVRRKIKDCVFTDFFGMPENLLKLYQVLHPEEDGITEEDLKDITLNNVLVDDIYNDLGFRVKNRLIILVEAQSTWSINIIPRSFLYLATTYQRYIDDNRLDIYRSKKVELPKPELYVIYTGNHKIGKSEISLQKEFFDGQESALDVRVKVLYGTDEEDVISQYVTFTKVYDEQRRLYGRTREAILATIRICKDRNILREYLASREKEVVTMMMTLYDEEQIMKNHDATLIREVTEQVTEQGIVSLVKMCKRMKGTKMDAVESVMADYGWDEERAGAIVKKYW